jgi:hypothetical protein
VSAIYKNMIQKSLFGGKMSIFKRGLGVKPPAHCSKYYKHLANMVHHTLAHSDDLSVSRKVFCV